MCSETIGDIKHLDHGAVHYFYIISVYVCHDLDAPPF